MSATALPSSYEFIIVGSGILESLLAGALSRSSRSVVHLDRNPHYGGSFSTLSINDLLQVLREQSEAEFNSSVEGKGKGKGEGEGSGKGSGCRSVPLPSVPPPFLRNVVISSVEKESLFPRSEQRRYNIDLLPCVLWSQGPLVDLLIRSGVSRYLEFKCMEQFLMPIEGVLQQVPCSKSDVFQNKNISLKEKRQLMKFLEAVIQPKEEDLIDFEQKAQQSFFEYLSSKGILNNLRLFIMYAIALIDTDQEKPNNQVTLAEGLRRLRNFMGSVGKYGNTPFLYPLYGTSELAQAFCRLSAVFGATYVLQRWATEILFENGKFSGIIDSTGQKIKGKYIIGNIDHLSSFVKSEEGSISRAICITDKSLSTDSDLVVVRFTPTSAPITINNTITGIQLSSSTMSCPSGKYLFHLTTKSTSTAKDDLEQIVRILFNHEDDQEKAENKPNLLWSCFYNHPIREYIPPTSEYQNLFITPDPTYFFGCEDILKEAEEIFKKIAPGEEFIPTVPHPEDIIYEPSQGTVDLENPIVKEQQVKEEGTDST